MQPRFYSRTRYGLGSILQRPSVRLDEPVFGFSYRLSMLTIRVAVFKSSHQVYYEG